MIRKDFTVRRVSNLSGPVSWAPTVCCSSAALLDTATIAKYLRLCDELGLSALVEAHDAREIRSAVAAGAKMIGVNNRNLKDFSVDFTNAARLRDLIPPEAVYVAESGVAPARLTWPPSSPSEPDAGAHGGGSSCVPRTRGPCWPPCEEASK